MVRQCRDLRCQSPLVPPSLDLSLGGTSTPSNAHVALLAAELNGPALSVELQASEPIGFSPVGLLASLGHSISVPPSSELPLRGTSDSSNLHDGPTKAVPSEPISSLSPAASLSGPLQEIPASQDASSAFEAMIDNMVEDILTCQKCYLVHHFEKKIAP